MDNKLELSPEEKKDIKKFFGGVVGIIFLMALPGIIITVSIGYILFHFLAKVW